MTVLVFLDPAHDDGRLVDATQPQLLATDLGATRGDGIFESMLAVDGTPRKEQAHLDRLASSAAALDLTVPGADAWSRAIRTGLGAFAEAEPDRTHAVVKLVATRGVEGAGQATAWVQVAPVPAATLAQREAGLKVLFLERGYDSTVAQRAPWLLMGAKTLSYAVNMAAIRYAKAQGADDVIFTSSDGKVLEGPTSTVLLAYDRDGRRTLLTPQLESGILAGTSQSALFVAAKEQGWELGYGPLEPHHLLEADAVWLISSIRLLAPVLSLDGQELRTSAALTAELTGLVERFV
ncbi:aminodeoxychorismate lyase [Arthrobacter agilis]|uniref:aminodeoxychorismate lyase n=1 Tax=Arthrobacter agilis TaxID=37921 RepID=UPI000B34CF89|nr:aminodeoxychorismate lyase [Arthrobacter agilis]OUM43100.1 4-amino-4-deoxychorismate lyase [Arthrobacter agilis]PPB46044.1 aminodeoxychorismate lyase [Arthrobacter agilis]TPV25586.1 aminodeoxychorismate lyase [Arthrobacter agilis]VDR33354.1 D-alanine aminotransferase [Arthrobacter agilis]